MAFARLAPAGGAVVQLIRYDDGRAIDPAAGLAELEDLLDRIQPGWREVVVERRFLPSVEAASRLDCVSERGIEARPPVRVAPGLYLAGDWVGHGSWLSDVALASARAVGQELARAAPRRVAA